MSEGKLHTNLESKMLFTFQQNITQRQEKKITKYRAKPVNKHVVVMLYI